MTTTTGDAVLDLILTVIPPGYRGLALILIMGSPYIGRAYFALRNNGGLRGVLMAVMLGTNAPSSQPKTEDEKSDDVG
jgi:hypothetical protein